MGQAKCTTSVSNVCNLRGSGGSPSDLHMVWFACGMMGSDITRARAWIFCAAFEGLGILAVFSRVAGWICGVFSMAWCRPWGVFQGLGVDLAVLLRLGPRIFLSEWSPRVFLNICFLQSGPHELRKA